MAMVPAARPASPTKGSLVVFTPPVVSLPPVDGAQLRKFLAGCECYDWRKISSEKPGGETVQTMLDWAVSEMRAQGALTSSPLLEACVRAAAGKGISEVGVEWLADVLLVAQLNAAVRHIIARQLRDFDCNSVPEGVLWLDAHAPDLERTGQAGHWSFLRDTSTVCSLLATLLEDGSGERWLEGLDIRQKEESLAHGGFGPVYLMFCTARQFVRATPISGVEFFRPYWPDVCRRLRALLERLAMEGRLAEFVPTLWLADVTMWEGALVAFEAAVLGMGEEEGTFREFVDFSITLCYPMWLDGAAMAPADPRWHPVAACKHLLSRWFGASHLFAGDGYAWSEGRKRVSKEWAVDSFECFDLDRVPIFPGI